MKLQLEPCYLDALVHTVFATDQPFYGKHTVTFDASESSLIVMADIV